LTTRIGLVADTHCPEFIDHLPPELFERLEGVDMILHAGDVGGLETLAELGRLAPVYAVRGDHDLALGELPVQRTIDVDGRTIGLVHGNRNRAIEEPLTFISTVSLGLYWPTPGIDAWLQRRFAGADVIVHGHTHEPSIRRRGGTLIVNPGAVYQVTPRMARRRLAARPSWFEWSWLQVMRHRRRHPAPSVGLLELSRDGVMAAIVRL
jgi:putative phosphoesterase